MRSYTKTFKTVVLEDGAYAVVRTASTEPHILEMVAVFYDGQRARKYADIENAQFAEPAGIEPASAPEEAIDATNGLLPELTERQRAVLKALREKAGDDRLVEIKAIDLADAASIPLGSVHSVIQSLEKKKCIQITRPGSSHASAVYRVL